MGVRRKDDVPLLDFRRARVHRTARPMCVAITDQIERASCLAQVVDEAVEDRRPVKSPTQRSCEGGLPVWGAAVRETNSRPTRTPFSSFTK